MRSLIMFAVIFSCGLPIAAQTAKPTPTPKAVEDMTDDEAIKALSDMQRKDAAAADKLLDQANALIAQGKDRDALPLLDQARSLNSNDTRILAAGAIALLHLGELDRAEQAANFGVNNFFAGREIYDALGEVLRAKKDLKGAIDSYGKSIGKDDAYAIAYYHRGVARSESNDNTGALADYTKALQLDPKIDDAYFKRGFLYIFVLNEAAKGIADFDSFIRLHPNESYAYSDRASGYFNLKQFDKALADDNKALELRANNKYAFANRGAIYAEQGRYDLAKADYQKALVVDPNFQFVKDRMADLEKRSADAKDDAAKKAETEKLIAGIVGKDQKLTADTADWLKRTKEAQDASQAPTNSASMTIRGESNAVTAPPAAKYKDANEAFNDGMALVAKNDIDGALAAFQAALAMDPKLGGAANNIGAMYVKKNDLEKALHAYLLTVDIAPDLKMGQENLDAVALRIRDARNSGTITLSKQGLKDYYIARLSFYDRQLKIDDDAVTAELNRRSSTLNCSVLQRAYETHNRFNTFLRDVKYDQGRGAITLTPEEAKDIPAAESSNLGNTTRLFDRMHELGCIIRAFDQNY